MFNIKRLLARMRCEFPCLIYVIGLVAGQVLGLLSAAALRRDGELLPFSWLASLYFAIVFALLRPFLGRSLWIALLLAGAGGILSTLIRAPIQAVDLPDSKLSYIGTISESPRFRRPGEVSFAIRLEGELKREVYTYFRPREPILVYCRGVHLPWKGLGTPHRGDVYLIRGDFTKLDGVLFSYEETLLRNGFSAKCRARYALKVKPGEPTLFEKLRQIIERKIKLIVGDNEPTALFLSMTIGLRDLLSVRTEEAFKRTGLAHLLVVSGYQITLCFLTVQRLARALAVRIPKLPLIWPVRNVALIFGLLSATLYVGVSGIEGSTLRAALACVFTVVSRIFERGGGMLNSILVSLLILSVIWPGCYLEPGVQLTFSALFGIALGSLNNRDRPVKAFIESSLYASLFTSLVGAIWFETLSLVGFVLNIFVAPVASVIFCQGGLLMVVLHLLRIDSAGHGLSIAVYLVQALEI